jgi:hypothetical protein
MNHPVRPSCHKKSFRNEGDLFPQKLKLRFLRKHRTSPSGMEKDYFPGFLRPPAGKNRGIHRTRCKGHIRSGRD